jgi:hypothetical protein
VTETQGGVKRHHPEPLLHRTVRLAVLHTGRGDCSPHKITAKFKTTFCVPLSAVLAPRRTPQSVSPATHHSAQAPLLRFLCEDGAFLLFSCPSSVVLRRTQPQGGTAGTARPDRAHHRVRGDPVRRRGTLKGGRRLFKAPPRQLHVADNGGCSPLLTAPNPCTPLERGRKRLAQPTVIQKAYQCLVRHVSRLQVDGRAAGRSRQASEKKRRGQQSTLSSSPQGAN